MSRTWDAFQQRMRRDRAFRQRILAARRAGTLPEILAQEGCEFDLGLVEVQLPQVQTGIRAGADNTDPSSCYCLMIGNDKKRYPPA